MLCSDLKSFVKCMLIAMGDCINERTGEQSKKMIMESNKHFNYNLTLPRSRIEMGRMKVNLKGCNFMEWPK